MLRDERVVPKLAILAFPQLQLYAVSLTDPCNHCDVGWWLKETGLDAWCRTEMGKIRELLVRN